MSTVSCSSWIASPPTTCASRARGMTQFTPSYAFTSPSYRRCASFRTSPTLLIAAMAQLRALVWSAQRNGSGRPATGRRDGAQARRDDPGADSRTALQLAGRSSQAGRSRHRSGRPHVESREVTAGGCRQARAKRRALPGQHNAGNREHSAAGDPPRQGAQPAAGEIVAHRLLPGPRHGSPKHGYARSGGSDAPGVRRSSRPSLERLTDGPWADPPDRAQGEDKEAGPGQQAPAGPEGGDRTDMRVV